MSTRYDKIYACLCGGIIGDAMGAPAEGMLYPDIQAKFGWIDSFEGAGTDDSAIKLILVDALMHSGGHVTADEWGAAFLRNKKSYGLFYIPVRNMFHKLEDGLVKPVDAGRGNMHSSSSAMSISPMGIINACDPRRAAAETWDAAGLIHGGVSGFCRDGACAIAAAVAAAFYPDATVNSVTDAAVDYLHPVSGIEMIGEIREALRLANTLQDYEAFRRAYYADHLRGDVISDSRETVPCALALFALSGGDGKKAVEYAANFGRDADTIGTMVGAICGAFGGVQAFPAQWMQSLEASYGKKTGVSKDEYNFEAQTMQDQRQLAADMEALLLARMNEEKARIEALEALAK